MEDSPDREKLAMIEKGICPECKQVKLIPSDGLVWTRDQQGIEYACDKCGKKHIWYRFRERIDLKDKLEASQSSEKT